MQFKELLESTTLDGAVEAFHGGSSFNGPFDLSKSGTGEGMRVLGPGVYFTTSVDSAAGYAVHYGKGIPTIYHCEVDVSDFHGFSTPRVAEPMLSRWNALAVELGYSSFGNIPSPKNPGRNGWNQVGKVVEQLGDRKAREMFIKHGIKGTYESIGSSGTFEICVFDLKTITVHYVVQNDGTFPEYWKSVKNK